MNKIGTFRTRPSTTDTRWKLWLSVPGVWSLRQSLADGPVPVESWPPLRRLFLIHNPGLGGILTLLDRAFERDPPR